MCNVCILYLAQWDPLSRKLTGDGHKLVAVTENLVDLVWDDQPPSPSNNVIVQPAQYAGNNVNEINSNVEKVTYQGHTDFYNHCQNC